MAKQARERLKDPAGGRRFWRYCLVLLIAGTVALIWPSMLTYSPTDPPASYVYPPKHPVDNAVGLVGAHIAYTLRYWLGAGSYMGLLFLTVAALVMTLGGKVTELPWRIIGVLLLIVATSAALYLIRPGPADDVAGGASGVLGLAAGRFVLEKFSRLGSYIILALTFCVGLMLTADNLVLRLPGIGRRVWARRIDVAGIVGAIGQKVVKPAVAMGGAARSAFLPASAATATMAPPVRKASPSARADAAKDQPAKGAAAKQSSEKQSVEKESAERESAGKESLAKGSAGKASADAAVAVLEPSAKATQLATVPAKKPIAIGPAAPDASRQPKPAGKKPESAAEYELPSADALAEPPGGYNQQQEAQAAHNKELLQQTFRDFNVAAEVVGYQTGPVITLFELALAPGVKVSQVANLSTDIARALAVPGVRVVPPRFGKDTIGVEVPNPNKEIVRIKELMKLAPESEKKMQLPLYFGKDAGGNAIVADLSAMPHMLIAGTTGSGKSVCINSIIISLLMTRMPDDVRLILVDPKMVEMAAFENLPHLLCPIVNDMKKAEDILEWATVKMDERYELLKEADVKNIAGFNRLSKDEIYKRFNVTDEAEKARIPTRLPYYVIIIDELADLIMTSDKEVETHIIRIAQKARAVGIHLILATQRPSVNVVTGLIKSNMPCRISFRVASRQESRIVLDQNGAEVLLGQGDMLFLQPGNSTLIRAQGTYVDDSEIKSVVSMVKERGAPSYDPELMRLDSGPTGEGGGEKDEMFDQGVEIVLASQRGSVSLLQRRLQVGYSRASRIIDQMAEAGILGDYKGSQARECMMTLEQWQALKASVAADQSGATAANGEPTSS